LNSEEGRKNKRWSAVTFIRIGKDIVIAKEGGPNLKPILDYVVIKIQRQQTQRKCGTLLKKLQIRTQLVQKWQLYYLPVIVERCRQPL
jgi:hypothetical protein